MIAKKIALWVDRINSNHRIYPRHEVEKAIPQAYEKIDAGRMIGVIGNDMDDPDNGFPADVSLKNACATIREVYMEYDALMVVYEILPQYEDVMDDMDISPVMTGKVDISEEDGVASVSDLELRYFAFFPKEEMAQYLDKYQHE